MTTTWYVGVPVLLAALAAVAVLVKPDLLHWRLSPTTPDVPGDDDREASDPVEHEGATEEWGAKLRALREGADHTGQELLANLRASALAEVEAHEQVAAAVVETYDALLARFNARLDDILAGAKKVEQRAKRQLRPDAHGQAWLAAGLPGDTGQFDRRELDAMLAGA